MRAMPRDSLWRFRLLPVVLGAVLVGSVPTAPPALPADAGSQPLLYERGSELVTANADGSDQRVVVEGRWRDPVWSPDAGHIAYVGTDPDTGERAVRVVEADGADDHLVLAGLGDAGFVVDRGVDWSPDGERLVVGLEGQGLVTVRPDGTEVREITSVPDSEGPTVGGELLPVIDHRARWSPDGARIAFVRTDTGAKRDALLLVDAAGGDPETVVEPDDVRIAGLDWSPAGDRLAFHLVDLTAELDDPDRIRHPSDVFTVDADGSGLRQLTETGRARWPAWSPTESSLALAVGSGGGFEDERDLFLVDADGANLRRVMPHEGSVADPDWSPDATRIAFTSWACCVSGEHRPRAATDVFAVHADGTGLRQVTDDTRSRRPQFAPDEQEAPPAAFTDRPHIAEAHRPNVDRAVARGFVTGFADGSFRPSLPVRRDQMATLLAGALEAAGIALPESADDRFDDVAAGSAHEEAISRLAGAGLVEGGPLELHADSFGPNVPARRDQTASLLARAAEFATGDDFASEAEAFVDVAETNPHFATVNGAAAAGLVHGFGDGSYRPAAQVRRDQAAGLVVRLLDHLDAAGSD